MSNDKMREEFETAVALEAGEPVLAVYLSRRNETYSTSTLHFAWWAWKASRESMVVELPTLRSSSAYANHNDFGPEDLAKAYKSAHFDCQLAIESAGLKVKP